MILNMIDLSEYSYHRNLDRFRDKGFITNYEIIRDNDYCVISEDKLRAVVTFRGTDDIADMKDNFKIRWGRLLKGKPPRLSIKDPVIGHVHKGFFDAWLEMKPQLMEILKPIILSGKTIYTDGHSKGGALAVHCALYCSMAFNIHVKAFTQGCPKVGKDSFCEVMKGSKVTHHRLVNGKDAVPRLPRGYMGFKHDCKADHMEDGWFTWLWLGDFSDHPILEYKENYMRKFK